MGVLVRQGKKRDLGKSRHVISKKTLRKSRKRQNQRDTAATGAESREGIGKGNDGQKRIQKKSGEYSNVIVVISPPHKERHVSQGNT